MFACVQSYMEGLTKMMLDAEFPKAEDTFPQTPHSTCGPISRPGELTGGPGPDPDMKIEVEVTSRPMGGPRASGWAASDTIGNLHVTRNDTELRCRF